ncbi:MAG: folylpolyglutamate synthase/dihydrofolate synthase family protein [Gemmatimonadaceae bacterium]
MDPLAPPATPQSGAGANSDAAYRKALEALFTRTTGAWRLGLERVAGFLDRLGNPQLEYPVFHVAGTNGKGSTVATLDALLRGAGYRVGRYTSPHLVDFRERIVVDEIPMSPEAIVEFLAKWDPEAAKLGTTFFEVTTAMALSHFALQKVDVALVEVGLGGRLDATNVVQPVAAAVTQIGFDHVEFLGDSLVEIAGEKAGIFKRNAVAVIGDTRPETAKVLLQHAQKVGASEILMTGRDWKVSNVSVGPDGTSFSHKVGDHTEQLRSALTGVFQAENSTTALAMLRGAGGDWAKVANRAAEFLPQVRIAGRFHRVEPYIFDVAHNPDGAATVAANLRRIDVPQPIVAVVSVLADKDWKGILKELASVTEQIILTDAPTAPASRSWNAEDVWAWTQRNGFNTVLERNFEKALELAKQAGRTVLITGSFHTVGDAMERLQVDPLAR